MGDRGRVKGEIGGGKESGENYSSIKNGKIKVSKESMAKRS